MATMVRPRESQTRQNSNYAYSGTTTVQPPPQPQQQQQQSPQYQYEMPPIAPSAPPPAPEGQPQYIVAGQANNVNNPPSQAPKSALKRIIFVIIIIVGVIVAVIFGVRPLLRSRSFIKFNVNAVSLNRFELDPVQSSTSPFYTPFQGIYNLNYSLVLSFRLRNSYLIGVQYNLINVTTYYQPKTYELLALADSRYFTPFNEDPMSEERYYNIVYEGYGEYPFDTDTYFSVVPYAGPFSFYVNMKVDVSYSSSFLKFFLKENWNLWQCFDAYWRNTTHGYPESFDFIPCVNWN